MSEETKNTEEQLEATEVQETSAPAVEETVEETVNPEQFLAELTRIYNLGWRNSVSIVDDNFIGNKTKLKNGIKI